MSDAAIPGLVVKVVEPDAGANRAHRTYVYLTALGVDRDRVTIIGFSQGAAMALVTAMTHPGLASEIVLLSGLRVSLMLDEIPADVALPRTLIHHGIEDSVVPISEGRALRDWCLKQNPENVTYGEYEIGHTITQETLTDVIAWLAARPE